MYRSYSNGDKDRYACRSSRQNGIHDVFDRPKQPGKTADVFGIPSTKGANNMRTLIPRKVTEHRKLILRETSYMRYEEFRTAVVEVS